MSSSSSSCGRCSGPPTTTITSPSPPSLNENKNTCNPTKPNPPKTTTQNSAVVVISGTIVALSLAFSLVNAIDKIPVVSDLVELVGIGVTGWFTYRYLTVGPDRDEFFIQVRAWIKKIYGQF